ncbi:MAG: ferrochelatase [Proteobacteria bacterium]|nr:ferrochelatase [Pseudomonadota bacterium]
MKKIAVVLFNLGGPDSLFSVKPFLFNLFKDPAILNFPKLIRYPLAFLLSTFRKKEAIKNYKILGGKSPLLENTLMQANHLQNLLQNDEKLKSKNNFKVLVSMRYWHPFFKETFKELSQFNPDEILLLPLYPQFSTTTTASSLKEALKFLKKTNKPTTVVCCYPNLPGFINAIFDLSKNTLKKFFLNKIPARILFVAHGLPLSIVKKGDPYPNQLLLTVSDLTTKIKKSFPKSLFSYKLCYQSKVGPLTWLQPSLEEELHKAAVEKKGVIVIPISFVSEHSETLVELDYEYKNLSLSLNLPFYIRIPTVSCHPTFIKSLKNLILEKISQGNFPQKGFSCACSNFVFK